VACEPHDVLSKDRSWEVKNASEVFLLPKLAVSIASMDPSVEPRYSVTYYETSGRELGALRLRKWLDSLCQGGIISGLVFME